VRLLPPLLHAGLARRTEIEILRQLPATLAVVTHFANAPTEVTWNQVNVSAYHPQ
jgi:hypothetical protein